MADRIDPKKDILNQHSYSHPKQLVISSCSTLSFILATILRASARADEMAGGAGTAEGVVATKAASGGAAVGGASVLEEDEGDTATDDST